MTIPRNEIDLRADEYVLGLMEESDAEAFEKAIETDPELSRIVGAARDRFLPLDLSAEPAGLPPGFTDRVRNAITADGAEQVRGATGERTAANLPRRPSRAIWAALAAGLVGVAIGLNIPWGNPDPLVIAVLLNDAGQPQAVIEDYGNASAKVRFVADVEVPEGRTMQLWTLPSAEMGPVSLGVLSDASATVLSGPDLPRPGEEQLYEITFEPLGGSPSGRPTGESLGKGLAAAQPD
jgi:anti-sigma-K factor RskA